MSDKPFGQPDEPVHPQDKYGETPFGTTTLHYIVGSNEIPSSLDIGSGVLTHVVGGDDGIQPQSAVNTGGSVVCLISGIDSISDAPESFGSGWLSQYTGDIVYGADGIPSGIGFGSGLFTHLILPQPFYYGIPSTFAMGQFGLVSKSVDLITGLSGFTNTSQFDSGVLTKWDTLAGLASIPTQQEIDSGTLVHALPGQNGIASSSELDSGSLAHVLSGQDGIGQFNIFDSSVVVHVLSGEDGLASQTQFDAGSGLLVTSIVGSSSIVSQTQISIGAIAHVVLQTYGAAQQTYFDSGSVVHVLSGASLEIQNVFDQGQLSVSLAGLAGIENESVFGQGILISGLAGTDGIVNVTAFSSGTLVHQLRGLAPIQSTIEIGSGQLAHVLSGGSLVNTSQFDASVVTHRLSGSSLVFSNLFGSGTLAHVLVGANGLAAANQFGTGLIYHQTELAFEATGDFSINSWVKDIFSSIEYSSSSDLTIKGELIGRVAEYEPEPEYTSGLYISHLTQRMLNYFDSEDQRIRGVQHTIDHQLLNVAATALEKSSFLMNRFASSTKVNGVPVNLDSRGIYYHIYVPPELSKFSKVEANRDSIWVTLAPFDDVLMVPSSAKVDSARKAIRFVESDATLATLTSSSPSARLDASLKLPGPLSIEVAGMPDDLEAELSILGEEYPSAVWSQDQALTYERIQIGEVGNLKTTKSWQKVHEVSVMDLPEGVTVTISSTDMLLSRKLDPLRPVSTYDMRGVVYDRYWSLENGCLNETYFAGRYSGYKLQQTYRAPSYSSMAIEPNTYGMFASDGRNLFYLDRREPVPDSTDRTAITKDPYWGLSAKLDEEEPWKSVVRLTPIKTSLAPQCTQWRYVVESPDGRKQVLIPGTGCVPYSDIAGFRSGEPKEVSFPLEGSGTWIFTLEGKGWLGDRHDTALYSNLSVSPKVKVDMSQHLTGIAGLAFDSKQSLWAWTGEYLIPVKLEYDRYVYDKDNKAMYFTTKYLEVRLK